MELIRTVRQHARRLGRARLFTVICVATLALGIGATTAIYAVVDAVLLEPLPYPAHDRLAIVWHAAPGVAEGNMPQSPALHYTYEAESRTLEALGMTSNGRGSVTQLGDPEEVRVTWVTHGTLGILGARPVRGRLFSPSDDEPGAPQTALVSWAYWQNRLDGAQDVVGRTITLDGVPREIIGVLPDDFRVLDAEPAIYIPFQFDRAQLFVGNFSYTGIARLRPGTSLEAANTDLARLLEPAMERFPGPISLENLRSAGFAPNLRPLTEQVIGDVASVLWVLLATVGAVLLIAFANVANLFLVRAEGRYREVALRTALGASRTRLAREFLSESMLLSLLGGMIGLALAAAGLQLLHALAPEQLPRLAEVGIDGSVVAVALLLTMSAGAVLGLVPIVRHGTERVSGILREGGRGGSAGRERHRARNALVVGQLAMALVLLTGSGLMIRTALALRDVHPGFTDPSSLLTLRLAIPSAAVEEPQEVALMHERILRNLQGVPGVSAAGIASAIPMSDYQSNDPLEAESAPMAPGQVPPIRRFKWISPGFFETMGTPLVAGRAYTWDDVRNLQRTVMLSESLARELFGTPEAAIGQRVRPMEGRPWSQVIGVVGDVQEDGLDQDALPIAYWPMLQPSIWEDEGLNAPRSMAYVLRLATPATPALMDAVRRAVWDVNASLPLADVQTVDVLVEDSMARTSFTLVMLSIAAGVALVLGAVGLYGVMSYTVAQRTREFGVRIALGAQAADVGGLVLRHATLLVGIGLAIGLAAAFALTRLMSALLYGVAPSDVVTFGSVAALLALVALVASLVPVARASRVDPLDALRTE
ncbi:MAG TPA: ABC transporter permease [Longimicrobiales bacterium]|nr:ABC transporter permease [Longimicrobiales bacterium]